MDLEAVRGTTDRMGVVIRDLDKEDREDVRSALIACGAFNEEEIRTALEMFQLGIEGEYALFGAVENGVVVGYTCLGRAPLTESTWYVYWICVHPSAQRRGIGHALQLETESFVRARGGKRVVLETSGRADYRGTRRFYEKAGYVCVGRIPDFYRDSDDCLIYLKLLG